MGSIWTGFPIEVAQLHAWELMGCSWRHPPHSPPPYGVLSSGVGWKWGGAYPPRDKTSQPGNSGSELSFVASLPQAGC